MLPSKRYSRASTCMEKSSDQPKMLRASERTKHILFCIVLQSIPAQLLPNQGPRQRVVGPHAQMVRRTLTKVPLLRQPVRHKPKYDNTIDRPLRQGALALYKPATATDRRPWDRLAGQLRGCA